LELLAARPLALAAAASAFFRLKSSSCRIQGFVAQISSKLQFSIRSVPKVVEVPKKGFKIRVPKAATRNQVGLSAQALIEKRITLGLALL
jgi:hypothetical protein